MWIPFLVFWVLLLVAREELGFTGIAVAILVWALLVAGFAFAGISPLYFVAVQSILDIALILMVFREDIVIG